MNLTFEQIETGAKAMFGFNAISNMEMPRWDAIDQGERNHWLHLSETCLRAVGDAVVGCPGLEGDAK